MKVEIIEKTDNPLFKRTEIKFKADHAGEPTPKRLDVRVQLANQLGVAAELIVIEKLASTHGRQMASGIARAYSSREQLEGLEPKFLLQRGMPKEAKPEKPPEKAEKPKEEMKKPKDEKVEKPKEEKFEAKEKPSEADESGKES